MGRTSDILKSEVLIVSEDAAELLVLVRMLRSAGYASVASTCDRRKVCARHRSRRFGLVLLADTARIECDVPLPVLAISRPFDRVGVLTRVRDALEAVLQRRAGTPVRRRAQRGLGGARGPR